LVISYVQTLDLHSFPTRRSSDLKGGIDDTIRYAVENDVDEIYSTISPEQNPAIYELAATANKNLIHFRFVPDLHSFVNRNYYLRSEEHTSELQSRFDLVCRLLLE